MATKPSITQFKLFKFIHWIRLFLILILQFKASFSNIFFRKKHFDKKKSESEKFKKKKHLKDLSKIVFF